MEVAEEVQIPGKDHHRPEWLVGTAAVEVAGAEELAVEAVCPLALLCLFLIIHLRGFG